jgi:hypothetical protein
VVNHNGIILRRKEVKKMKKKGMMYKILCIVLLGVMSLTLALPSVALAADSANVTVTAQALFLSITNTPNTWTVNGIAGAGTVLVDTIYYANPLGDTTAPSATVLDAECLFNVSNHVSGTPCDLTVTWGSFTGGDTTMTNSDNAGENGATTYGAFGYYSGLAMANKVVIKSTGSSELYDTGLAAGASLKWGVQIETRTNDWTGAGASTATITITATEH